MLPKITRNAGQDAQHGVPDVLEIFISIIDIYKNTKKTINNCMYNTLTSANQAHELYAGLKYANKYE